MNNILSILLFINFCFYLFTGVYLFKINYKCETNISLFILCICTSLWAFGYAFMIISKDIYIANFWRIISSLGWCFLFIAWIQFALSISNTNKINTLIKLILLAIAIFFFVRSCTYDPYTVLIKTENGWIDKYPTNLFEIIFFTNYSICLLIGMFFIFSWGKNSNKKRERRQSIIIGFTSLIAFIFLYTTDFILPLIGIQLFHFGILAVPLAILGIWYSVIKYKIMSLTPKYVSDYIFKSVNDPIFFIGEDLCIKNVNKIACSITGYNYNEIKNSLFITLIENHNFNLRNLLKDNFIKDVEINLLKKDNNVIPCILSGTIVYDDFNDMLGIVIILHDISERKKREKLLKNYNLELEKEIKERTLKLKESNKILQREIIERKKVEKQIEHMIYFDELTGLPNRRYFKNFIENIINKHKENYFAVMFLDLDNFKLINDTLGHQEGDILLKEFSKRIKQIIRKNDILARIGGDEFLFLVNDLNSSYDTDTINLISQRIMTVLKKPFIINHTENFITISIGVAFYPIHGIHAETLIKNSDSSMYKAKFSGKDNIKIYSKEIKAKLLEETKLKNSLHRALAKNELYVYYQPKINLKLNRISGFEALLRWKFNNKHFISPDKFIPLAEETGLIVSIGYWVIKTSCKQLKHWHNNGFNDVNIAINVSVNQLKEKDFVYKVKEILKEVDLNPIFVEFEITERIALQDTKNIFKVLTELNSLGIKISVDDFGTKYSSFVNIKNIPINKIKIDMEFIQGLEKNKKDAAIVRSIISLGHNLGLEVIAEGVETKYQLQYLKKQNCDQIQGYIYYKPMSSLEIENILYLA
ncbi:EAL domain-containing protein [Clostridium niameyense]|uniref:EAL domain-containing protein n=1 Tax=Clostridium niameyense TaxID=1622073 RepID=UPI00067EE686|nr:EAL domain-containing protein [Clostridium niameyense]